MEDLKFVQRCAKGDNSAWAEFVQQYSRLIYGYIHSVLKFKSQKQFTQDNINDIYQDIFVLLAKDNFRKLKTFKGKNGCSLASWLRQVTINYTIDYLRRVKPAVSLEEEIGEEMTLKDILADDSTPIKDILNFKEKLNGLKDCIGGLDRDDRYFLELNLNQHLTLEELRGLFKVSRGTVDMRKARIVQRLKDCFKKKGFLLDY
ncbi:MAG: sigma-70 family RNA polymerase sigma factor [Candidatus Omnitrophica bacterium]|nr:sigma-70 family RNA polymerase sigma factor [Candidatus Omnitrophota bacterium]